MLLQIQRKKLLQLLDGVARDSAQDFTETVKRINFVDLEGIQGKHTSFHGDGRWYLNQKKILLYSCFIVSIKFLIRLSPD